MKRAHQAADWQQFMQEADVLPNLKWMPSTSPNPGADHMPFWGTILPIDDPFWDRVNRARNITDITLIQNGKDVTYTREQIIDQTFKIQPEDFK